MKNWKILPYNKVVKDLTAWLRFLTGREKFEIVRAGAVPIGQGRFGMLLEGAWYMLTAKEEIVSTDPVVNTF